MVRTRSAGARTSSRPPTASPWKDPSSQPRGVKWYSWHSLLNDIRHLRTPHKFTGLTLGRHLQCINQSFQSLVDQFNHLSPLGAFLARQIGRCVATRPTEKRFGKFVLREASYFRTEHIHNWTAMLFGGTLNHVPFEVFLG